MGLDSGYILVNVILPLRLEWEPVYRLPEELVPETHVGSKVQVTFAGKKYVSVISSLNATLTVNIDKVLFISKLLPELPSSNQAEIDLWRKIADYYMCSVGEVFKVAYPVMRISEELRPGITRERILARIALREKILEKARTQARIDKLKLEIAELKSQLDNEVPIIEDAIRPIELTPCQQKVHDEVAAAVAKGKPALIHGVTGSGKTEIYLKLAQETLAKGRNVLYLVPEIALSKQLEDRLRAVFGELLLSFNSSYPINKKRVVYQRLSKEGQPYVVLGTRSAIFLPHRDLGLVVVDEEHDQSFKQEMPAPRYNGRDTAIMLAAQFGSGVVLGSATPSMEALYNCQAGRFTYVRLGERYYGGDEASTELIDISAERRKHGMIGSFSRKLISQIEDTLSEGGQIMLLRARRSYAPAMQCDECGKIVKCPNCNVNLSLHKSASGEILLCHNCGYTSREISICPDCQGSLSPLGAGTQKIEEEAKALFPEARIARLDSDAAQETGYEEQAIKDFAEGKTDILVGTQIITKGFDFKGLRLVAVLQADGILGRQDFRADEKAFQLLEQFKGRCSRRGEAGKFIIQTAQPSHPIYSTVSSGSESASGESTNGIPAIYNSMLAERKFFSYPPFTRIVNVIVEGKYDNPTDLAASDIASELNSVLGSNCKITGPFSPALDRSAGVSIRHIRIVLKKDAHLHQYKEAISTVIKNFSRQRGRHETATVDVDPV
ncbi:MAG: primosomal protein N' [Bacteroidales bacterium]|nr:primosomal protein N' [Bacteroidales bacterium]